MTKPKTALDIETASLHPFGDTEAMWRGTTEAHRAIRDAFRKAQAEHDVVESAACTNTVAPNAQLMAYAAGLDYGLTEARILAYMVADTHVGAIHPDQHFTNEGGFGQPDIAMVIGDELHFIDFKNVVVVNGGDLIHHTDSARRPELDKSIGESLAKSIRQEAEPTIRGFHRQPKQRDWEQRTKKGRRR